MLGPAPKLLREEATVSDECNHGQDCPPFVETKLTVDGVCDCPEHNIGSKQCPLHGERVIGFEMGWNAAAQSFRAAAEMVQAQLPQIGTPRVETV